MKPSPKDKQQGGGLVGEFREHDDEDERKTRKPRKRKPHSRNPVRRR